MRPSSMGTLMLPRRWAASILERIERISFSRLELGMGWLEKLEGRVGGGAGWERVSVEMRVRQARGIRAGVFMCVLCEGCGVVRRGWAAIRYRWRGETRLECLGVERRVLACHP